MRKIVDGLTRRSCVENKCYDQSEDTISEAHASSTSVHVPVKTQDFAKNQNQNHADEDP